MIKCHLVFSVCVQFAAVKEAVGEEEEAAVKKLLSLMVSANRQRAIWDNTTQVEMRTPHSKWTASTEPRRHFQNTRRTKKASLGGQHRFPLVWTDFVMSSVKRSSAQRLATGW